MSISEIESKIRELRQLQALVDEAESEMETIKDALKAHMGDSEELRAGEYNEKEVTAVWLEIIELLEKADDRELDLILRFIRALLR